MKDLPSYDDSLSSETIFNRMIDLAKHTISAGYQVEHMTSGDLVRIEDGTENKDIGKGAGLSLMQMGCNLVEAVRLREELI